MFPNNQIFVASGIECRCRDRDPSITSCSHDDKAFKGIDYIIIPGNEDDLLDILDLELEEEFANSLVLFDDTDCITNPIVKKLMQMLKEKLLETGRHYNCVVLITSHTFSNYAQTRRILTEINKFVVYPKQIWNSSLRNSLKSYVGLDKSHVDRIKSFSKKSRWVCVDATYPMTCTYEDGVLKMTE
jgi:hypothetical protein